MSQVCSLIKFKHDSDRNTFSWYYTGGCYKGGDPVNYDDARPGESKDFKDIEFQVRLDHRNFDQISMLSAAESGEDDEEGTNSTNAFTPDNKGPTKETDA